MTWLTTTTPCPRLRSPSTTLRAKGQRWQIRCMKRSEAVGRVHVSTWVPPGFVITFWSNKIGVKLIYSTHLARLAVLVDFAFMFYKKFNIYKTASKLSGLELSWTIWTKLITFNQWWATLEVEADPQYNKVETDLSPWCPLFYIGLNLESWTNEHYLIISDIDVSICL